MTLNPKLYDVEFRIAERWGASAVTPHYIYKKAASLYVRFHPLYGFMPIYIKKPLRSSGGITKLYLENYLGLMKDLIVHVVLMDVETNRIYSFIRDVRKIGEGLGIYIPGNYGLTGGEVCSIRIVPIGYLSDSEEGMWVDTEMSEDDFEYEDSPADEDDSENEETAKEFDIESLIFDDL